MFDIALLNPLRFIDTSDINFSFDGDFAINRVLSYQDARCYFQKWQRSDTLYLQILSDYEPSDLLFRDVFTNEVLAVASWSMIETNIVGYTFKVYELEFAFIAIPISKCYAEFTYTDEDNQEHILISEPVCIDDIQENTLLIRYKHSENDFDVIFDTDIEFQFRVESAIKNFNPRNSRAVYNDQKYNATLLSATPYRMFKFFLGYKSGVPEWVVDKVNRIQSVDQVSYNGVYYQVPNDAEYELDANDDNTFMGGSIDIQPVENNFNKYQTNPNTENTFIPMQKVLSYYNVAADLPVANKFKAFSNLEKICINKRSAAVIDLAVGTTEGGTEIGVFEIDDSAFTQTIEWVFSGTTTVYLSGLDAIGTDCDIFLVYKQLDEPPVEIGNGSGVVPPPVGLGTVVEYEEVNPGDLNVDFDLSTGIGRANTNWSGWVICDGRNGTVNRKGKVLVAQDPDDPEFAELGQTGGEKKHTLSINEIPSIGSVITVDGGKIKRPQLGNGNLVYWPHEIGSVGGGQSHNNLQPYLVTMWVKKIA